MTTHAGPTCGLCGSSDVVPVVYGLPTAEMWQQEAAGAIALRGCMNDGRQAWRCRTCDQTTYLPARTTVVAVWADGTPADEIAAWLEANEVGDR